MTPTRRTKRVRALSKYDLVHIYWHDAAMHGTEQVSIDRMNYEFKSDEDFAEALERDGHPLIAKFFRWLSLRGGKGGRGKRV